jgi:N-acyl-D-amino-acid deacylase
VDGTGVPSSYGDLGVVAGRIVAVGEVDEPAARSIDADGLVASPGFIDMHAHSEVELLTGNRMLAKLAQGVTLELLGQDGVGLAPLTDERRDQMRDCFVGWSGTTHDLEWSWTSVSDLLDKLSARPLNVAYLVPHGNLRAATVGFVDRRPSLDEMAQMRRLFVSALRDGAVGLSTGLNYVPCLYADTEELIHLCEAMRPIGGFFSPHHRGYGVGAIDHYVECIEIARRTQVPLHLTHASLMYEDNRHRAEELLRLIDAARADDLDVTLDTYPYTAAAGTLAIYLPGWLREGSPSEVVERLRSTEVRDRLRLEMNTRVECTGGPMDWDKIVISGASPAFDRWIGHSLAAIAKREDRDPFDRFLEILTHDGPGVPCLEFAAYEDVVETIMKHPAHMAGSDGGFEGVQPHPRAWGTFARYLGHYSRDRGLLGLEEMVRKMTSLPAQRLGFTDRGVLRVGAAADIALFDPETVIDRATFTDPTRLADGFRHVLVNGVPVVEDGRDTGATPGIALRRAQHR